MNLDVCPVCGSSLVYPDKPEIAVRFATKIRVMSGVKCSKCPAVCNIRSDGEFAGRVISFVPHQIFHVRRVSGT